MGGAFAPPLAPTTQNALMGLKETELLRVC